MTRCAFERLALALGIALALVLSANAGRSAPPLPAPPLPAQKNSPEAGEEQPSPADPAAVAALGPVARWLVIGPSNGWDHRVEGGSYVMSNTSGPAQAVRYFANPLPAGATKVKVSAKVAISPQPNAIAGAGLIYAFDRAAQTYFAVTIQANDTVVTYVRGPGGLREMMRSSTPGFLKDGVNEITIIGQGNTAAILVNGQAVGTLTNDLLTTTKGAGILALGRGTFAFSAYSAEAVP